jgi:hypothetical protein
LLACLTFRMCTLATISIFLMSTSATVTRPEVVQQAETSTSALVQPITLIVRTDFRSYSMADTLKLDVSLKNTVGPTVYVDRRMFWGGFACGLKLVVTDDRGKPVPAGMLSDALMPPPNQNDGSILIRLDRGFFYGTSLDLSVKDRFPKAGKYSIRVVYKSWLRKEFVAPQLRNLPALWADTPEIVSEPISIEIHEK